KRPTGRPARVSIVTADRQDALLVPRQALLGNASPGSPAATIVTIAPDNHVQKTTVQLGLLNEQFAEVTGGLQEGQLVATGNAAGLNSGDLVAPQVQNRAAAAR